METLLFSLLLTIILFLLLMTAVSHYRHDLQFWPPPDKQTWQYRSFWAAFRLLFIGLPTLIYFEWSAVPIADWLRFYLALPVLIVSTTLGSLAFVQLGWCNTHGEAAGFLQTGLYRYSRNPQYVFYVAAYLSLAVLVASGKVALLLVLLSLWYLFAPFPEERWLEQRYGEKYLAYKRRIPRYWGRPKNGENHDRNPMASADERSAAGRQSEQL